MVLVNLSKEKKYINHEVHQNNIDCKQSNFILGHNDSVGRSYVIVTYENNDCPFKIMQKLLSDCVDSPLNKGGK